MNRKRSHFEALFFSVLILWGFATTAMGTTVSVAVRFDGRIPLPREVRIGGDKFCDAVNPKPVLRQDVNVGPDGGLAEVLVYVKSGLPAGRSWPVPKEPVRLRQTKCFFDPELMGIMVGQELRVKNEDATMHNVYSNSRINKRFNKALLNEKAPEVVEVFQEPEFGIRLKCDVQPWMQARISVFDHPFFGVTNSRGVVDLEGLPPGQYTIEGWHEKLGAQTGVVEVKDGEIRPVVLTFTGIANP